MSVDSKVWHTLNLSAARVEQIRDLFEVYLLELQVFRCFPLIKTLAITIVVLVKSHDGYTSSILS